MGISIVGILAIVVMAITVLISASIIVRSNKLAGKDIPEGLKTLLPSKDATLVFFHSERCPPCRNMRKVVDDLHAKGMHTLSIDVADEPEITKAMGIRATPTCLVVHNNKVSHVVLGACSERKLAKLIEKPVLAAANKM